MSSKIAIDSKFVPAPLGMPRETVSPASQGKRLGDDDQRLAIEIFNSCVDAARWAGKEAAYELGMSGPHFSEHKSGSRTCAFHRMIRGARKSTAFAMTLIRAIAAVCPDIEVRIIKKHRADKAAVRRQMMLSLERNPGLRLVALAAAARELGIGEEEAQFILDEPTQPNAVVAGTY